MLEADQTSFILGGIPFGDVDEFGVDWSIEKFDGWSGATKPTSTITQRARQSGGWRSASYASGRSIAASGKVFAPDAEALQVAFDRLNAAATARNRAAVTTPPSIVLVASPQRSDALVEPWPNYVAALKAIAATDTAIDVLDLTTVLPKVSGAPAGWYADTVHPTNKGHAEIAAALVEFVTP